jgi:predicted unusual protein kinase regulating ubiquinone biosynthesis (AarF/ABC1/UbiB family)
MKAYQAMDLLLPNADMELIKKAEAAAFERFWGKSMDELRNISFEEMHEFGKEFRELIFAMPFQVPQDLVFLFRTVAILAGICTGLDPDFNFWEVLAPYAQKLIAEEGGANWEFWLAEIGSFAQTLIALPRKAENVLGILESGRLSIRTPGPERELQRINRSLRRGVSAILFFAFLTNSVWLYLNGELLFAGILVTGAVISLAGLIFAGMRRS